MEAEEGLEPRHADYDFIWLPFHLVTCRNISGDQANENGLSRLFTPNISSHIVPFKHTHFCYPGVTPNEIVPKL